MSYKLNNLTYSQLIDKLTAIANLYKPRDVEAYDVDIDWDGKAGMINLRIQVIAKGDKNCQP